jgi:acetamidase/formamidase
MPTTHTLPLERRTLHGHFSRDLPPALTIDPGDTVRTATLDAGWTIEPYTGGDWRPHQKFEGRVKGLDDGHALTGPIAVRGAQPGMTLMVRIDALRPGPWGGCWAGGWPNPINQRLGLADQTGVMHAWSLDADALTGRNQYGHAIDLHPFLGVIGMPPDEPGTHSTVPPRVWGGNMDCKLLVAGSTLYLPIAVPGALLSVGDGHAAQGDGEVSGVAIECPMDHVELTIDVRDDFPISTPIAQTHAGWIALGFDTDLNEAALNALTAMIPLMERLHGLTRRDALALASVAVDLHVTQNVNGVRGVHAVLPPGRVRWA